MTLQDLIEKLNDIAYQENNLEKEVYLEGCDCEGPWSGEIIPSTSQGWKPSNIVLLLKREGT